MQGRRGMERLCMGPDLQKVGDTYYIYFPADDTNWVMTAKDIRGPWTKPADTGISGIDPGLAVTPDGKRYLFTSAGYVTPLTDDGINEMARQRRFMTAGYILMSGKPNACVWNLLRSHIVTATIT